MTPVVYDANGVRWREFPEAVTLLRSEALEDFPLEGERSFAWLAKYIKDHGHTPDGRQTKWASEQHIGKETSAYVLHDLCGLAIELCLSYDQLDGSNLACMEVVGRMYQLIEETGGSMRMEGVEHFIGRDKAGGMRRGIAVAPKLARHTTDKLAAEVEILKQRRKAREEAAAAKGGGRGRGNKKDGKGEQGDP